MSEVNLSEFLINKFREKCCSTDILRTINKTYGNSSKGLSANNREEFLRISTKQNQTELVMLLLDDPRYASLLVKLPDLPIISLFVGNIGLVEVFLSKNALRSWILPEMWVHRPFDQYSIPNYALDGAWPSFRSSVRYACFWNRSDLFLRLIQYYHSQAGYTG